MRAVLVAALVLLAAPAGAAAAPELVQLGEFSEPAALAAAPSDGSRLFVVERGGEDCTVTVRARRLRTRRVALSAGVRRSVPLVATRDGARRLRRALARKRTLKLTVRIAARDASGNVKRRSARPGVRA